MGGKTYSRYFFTLIWLMSMVTHTHFCNRWEDDPQWWAYFSEGPTFFRIRRLWNIITMGFPMVLFSYLPTKIAQGICQIWQKWWYPKAAIVSSWLPWHQCPGKSQSKIDPHGFFEFHPCCLDSISNKWRPVANWTLCRMRPVGYNSFFADPAAATHDS